MRQDDPAQGKQAQGKLVIVATPIGNLKDLTDRAKEALTSADVIYAEDTRVTAKLLSYLDSQVPIKRCDENVIREKSDAILDEVASGLVVAYCSDAGTPGISDPGIVLVDKARARGLTVEVLPGPAAVIAALVTSGLYTDTFYFAGFLPRKHGARVEALQALAPIAGSLVFYESPYRLVDTLKALAEVFPARRAAVVRELTKLHEEVVRDTTPQLLAHFSQLNSIKGELVIVVDAPRHKDGKPYTAQELFAQLKEGAAGLSEPVEEFIQHKLAQGIKKSEIAKQAADAYNMDRSAAYDLVVQVSQLQ